jgi:hypothetical protein
MSKKPNSAISARASRFKIVLEELRAASSLPPNSATELRLEAAAWCRLSAENLRALILRGEPISVEQLERYNAALESILPPVRDCLRVMFIDRLLCPKCRAETGGALSDPEPVPAPRAPRIPVADRETAAAAPSPAAALPPLPEPEPVRAAPHIASYPGAQGLGLGGSTYSQFDNRRA